MSQHIICNLCGADDYQVLFEAKVAQANQIVKCNVCGLMYANPRLQVDADAIQHYDPKFILDNLNSYGIQQRINKEKLQVKDYKDTKEYLNVHFAKRGKLLEIGSGFGFLLDYFRQDDWQVTGIEPNKGLCLYSQLNLGLSTSPISIEKSDIAPNSLDVALFIHVIEHVSDPLDSLKRLYTYLKPGGILVLETPRYDTLIFKALGKRERSLRCDGHIYFFTSKTLTEISQKAGFKVLKNDYVGRSLTLKRLAYNLGVIAKNSTFENGLVTGLDKLGWGDTSIYLNFRDMQRIYLKK